MIWFYRRDQQTLRAETSVDNATSEYVLVLHWPDGRSETERFPLSHPQGFQDRLTALQRDLERTRWQQQGPPVLVPDGWPERPLGNTEG